MQEPVITCPKCSAEIRLDESLAAPLVAAARAQFEVRKRELEEAMAARLKEQRTAVAAEEMRKAREAAAAEVAEKLRQSDELRQRLNESQRKLEEAQKVQAEAMRTQRQAEDQLREVGITVEKRVREELETARAQARKELDEAHALKDAEAAQTILSMQRTIADLQRKAAQGSQQLQGEVQELQLEGLLRERFPLDSIEPVAKGEHGADALQRVRSAAGQAAGSILWESKRTKNWSDGWLAKLRADQRANGSELAIIVTTALPAGVETFGCVEGVWVTLPKYALPLASSLRQGLLDVAAAREATQGQHTKMELLYAYLTGTPFRQRVEAMVEAYNALREDLETERKALLRLWARREKQLERILGSTSGMYGDLQGIAGRSLPEIQALEFKEANGALGQQE